MTTSPLLLGACVLAAGLTGGFATYLLTPSPVAASNPAADGISPASGALVSGQLEKLVTATESLERRLSMLESAGRGAGREVVLGEAEILGAPVDSQILAAVEAYMNQASGDQGSVRDIVANTLTEIRNQEDLDKEIARDERDAARLQTRVDKWAEDLGLYPDQATKLYDALWSEEVQRDEMRDAIREGTSDFTDMRDGMRDLRDNTALALEQFLTAEQIESYKASNNNNNRGGGGRNGGQGGGGNQGG